MWLLSWLPNMAGELMQLLRLLALPDGYASQMLQGSKRQARPLHALTHVYVPSA